MEYSSAEGLKLQMQSMQKSSVSDNNSYQVVTGLWGWLCRSFWKRKGRRMSKDQIVDLRKMLVIVDRQATELPVSAKSNKRRMEILKDRERLGVMISAWEGAHRP